MKTFKHEGHKEHEGSKNKTFVYFVSFVVNRS